MATIVGVQFQKNGKIFYYDTSSIEIHQDDFVIVDTSHGIDLGQAVVCPGESERDESGLQLKKVIRKATEKDLQASAENRRKEREAFDICQKKIAEHKLDMKLVSVEYAFDNSKALFYFTANGRVDFRSLVKDLASVFKMRIELRQIGVRDEARMLGGLGPCGRTICCGSFLNEFQPVSIKMAKEQNLSLNPTKISGVCGRLMCCLKYEQDHYEQTRKIMPRIGKDVVTPDGVGTVTDLNIVKETVFVRISTGDTSEIKEYPLDRIEKPAAGSAASKGEHSNDSVGSNRDSISCDSAGTCSETESIQTENPRRDQKTSPFNEKHEHDQTVSKKADQRRNEKGGVKSRQNSALGKPVIRENPNRKPEPQTDDAAAVKKEASSSWAEAVRKAIDSMN